MTNTDQVPPQGINFVFEMGVKLVEKQLETIDKLDAKIGVLWGLLSAVIIWTLTGVAASQIQFPDAAFPRNLPLYVFSFGILVFVIGFGFAFAALLPKQYYLPVNYRAMVESVELEESVIKFRFTEGVLQAYLRNGMMISRKSVVVRYSPKRSETSYTRRKANKKRGQSPRLNKAVEPWFRPSASRCTRPPTADSPQ